MKPADDAGVMFSSIYFILLMVVSLLILYGCGNVSTAIPPTQVASASPSMTLPSQGGELNYEENLAINPPPPTNVHVTEIKDKTVYVAWDPPPPVTVPHPYSDTIVSYQVFRREAGELDFRPLATTTEREYADRAVLSGHTYEYVVSSIREQNAEGTRSDPPALAIVP